MASTTAVSSFVSAARAAAVAWRDSWGELPDDARVPSPYGGRGRYDFVLPGEHRWVNLLPEAREVARSRFAAAGIRWHGDEDGPTPHLCSSQVQCLNALAPFVDEPRALAQIFGGVLPIGEVLPFGATSPSEFDATDHVVFEWQGGADHLGEWKPDVVRGAHATSADAAIRYRTPSGATEIALIEWKYLEAYPHRGRLAGTARYHESRLRRYEAHFWGADGPLRADLGFDYEDLFAEPIYQLARTQALAAAMERSGEQAADCVRVVYAAPSANEDLLRSSLGTMRFERFVHGHGGFLPDAWKAALRQPDRFVYFDTGELLAPESPVVAGFRERYSALTSAGSPPGAPPVPSFSDLQMALTMLRRVSSEEGVLEQVLEQWPTLEARNPGLLAEIAARAGELGEMARRLRAEEIAELLNPPPD